MICVHVSRDSVKASMCVAPLMQDDDVARKVKDHVGISLWRYQD